MYVHFYFFSHLIVIDYNFNGVYNRKPETPPKKQNNKNNSS